MCTDNTKDYDYKKLYFELLEKYNSMFEQLTGDFANACDENDLLKAANESAKKEITSLRHTIGGYITQAARAKKELAELNSDYEMAKKSVEELTKLSLDNKALLKDCVISSQKLKDEYDEQIRELKRKIVVLENDIENEKIHTNEAERTLAFYKNNYEYFKNMPWYKRIFAK